MYEHSDLFDPNNNNNNISMMMMMVQESTQLPQICFTQMGPPPPAPAPTATDTFSECVGPSLEPPFSQQEQDSTKTETFGQMGGGFDMEQEEQEQNPYINFNDAFNNNNPNGSSFDHPPDLLNLLNPNNNTTIGLLESSRTSSSYDPLLHLNLQPQQPPFALRNLFLHGHEFVFGSGEDGDGNNNVAACYPHHHHQDGGGFGNNGGDGVIEFATTQDLVFGGGIGNTNKRGSGKRGNKQQFPMMSTTTTERQRRVDLSSKFDALKELIPNPTKSDRASVVGDAVNYIRELNRTVNELKLLVEKKRFEKQRANKRHKLHVATKTEHEQQEQDEGNIESLRSSWITRKSKDTEVDVRIVDNEVTIKVVQRKRINGCLVLVASHVLDELNLDLHHVSGGHIGDFCSFMFNSKICEGSSVYASAIANKLIEVMDKEFCSIMI